MEAMDEDLFEIIGVGRSPLATRLEAAMRLCLADMAPPKPVDEALNNFLARPCNSSLRSIQLAVVTSEWLEKLQPAMLIQLIASLLLEGRLAYSAAASIGARLSWPQIDALPQPEREFAQMAQAVHHDELDELIAADEDHTLFEAARHVVKRLHET
jgi:hypothetical protein